MIRHHCQQQRTITAFDWPFPTALDEDNRWVKLSQCIPWEPLAHGYYQSLNQRQGRPAKDARLVIGAVMIKHKLCLSDRETLAQIQDDSMDGGGRAPSGTSAENPYLQYFVGLAEYQKKQPFAPSLFVEIRKRMGQGVFEVFHEAIIDALEGARKKPKPTVKSKSKAELRVKFTDSKQDSDHPSGPVEPESSQEQNQVSSSSEDACEKTRPPQGKLILDATVAPQAIRYPTDLSLLNEARRFSEQIIDRLYQASGKRELGETKKPRTYRVQARTAYLAI